MVGSAIYRNIKKNYPNDTIIVQSRSELDLLDQSKTLNFFDKNKIDEVYLCAAKVGGIKANNKYRADFIRENLQIQKSKFSCIPI